MKTNRWTALPAGLLAATLLLAACGDATPPTVPSSTINTPGPTAGSADSAPTAAIAAMTPTALTAAMTPTALMGGAMTPTAMMGGAMTPTAMMGGAMTPTAMMGGAMTPTAMMGGAMTPTAMMGGAMTPTAMMGGGMMGSKVVVSSKDFTEELLVGEMYALLLEKGGIPVERKLNLGATDIAQAALVKGDISLYPEYTGTGLQVVLKKDVMSDANAVYDTVKKGYQEQFKLTWLDQAPMNDTQALATTKAVADKYGLKTLSDLATKAPQLRLATIPEFQDRPDGIKGLQRVYGGFQFKSLDTFAIGLKYKALLDGKADVAVAFSTDGAIAGDNLLILQDDKGLWPPYHIAPVVRDDVLAANPKIATILNGLAPKLTDSVISALNWEVDGKKRDYQDVAKEFLTAQGMLK